MARLSPARSTTLRAAGALAALLLALPGHAEQPPPPPSQAPAPATTDPLPTTTAPNPPADPNRTAAPTADKAVVPPGSGQAPPPPVPTPPPQADRTLVDKPGEAGDVDEVVLPAKPAALLAGRAKWEDGVAGLRGAFERIRAELGKAGLAPAGRPIAVFTGTDDDGFQYEAMIPIQAVPAVKPTLGEGVSLGATPSGKAMRFAHKGSYDSIDGTYETLTAYLDAKDVVVQDRFIEEYVTDLKEPGDDGLDVNIYALTK